MTKFHTRLLVLVVVLIVLAVANVFDIFSLRGGDRDGANCLTGYDLGALHRQSRMDFNQAAGKAGENFLLPYIEAKQSGSYHKLTLISERTTTRHVWPWSETQQAMTMCSHNTYTDLGPLPNISAVICFHDNENISVILHTVHSIIQRTPPDLLHEIILVDDHSIKDDLQGILAIYCELNFGDLVKIHRSPKQLGLIKARLHGINLASGEVVVIMDSHVEVQNNWIKPLLYEIKKNRKTMAASYLDWVTPMADGYEYKHGGTTWKTYFDWALVFGWQAMSEMEKNSRQSLIDPLKVAVTIGTIYAIERKFFHEIGGFDPGMQLWGGENLDLPVRVWLCGGQVLQLPCSRAGHIEFPRGRDYRRTWDAIIHQNYKRFAEVWMGDYKKYVYWQYTELPQADVGDLSERLALKQQCSHDFKWFLDNVFPEIGLPDVNSFAYGGVRNSATGLCLHCMSVVTVMWDCGDKPSTQGFFWNTILELRFPMHVYNARDVSENQRENGIEQMEYTSFYKEGRADQWIHWKGGPLYNVRSGLCADHFESRSVSLMNCTGSPNQRWTFQTYTTEYEQLVSGGGTYGVANELLAKVKAIFQSRNLNVVPTTAIQKEALTKRLFMGRIRELHNRTLPKYSNRNV